MLKSSLFSAFLALAALTAACGGAGHKIPPRATSTGTTTPGGPAPQSVSVNLTLSGEVAQAPTTALRRFQRQASAIEAGDPMTESQAFDTSGDKVTGELELLVRATRSSRREIARLRFSGGDLSGLKLPINLLEAGEPLGIVIKNVGDADPTKDHLQVPPLGRHQDTAFKARFVRDGSGVGVATMREVGVGGVETGMQVDVSTRFPRNSDGLQDSTDAVARTSTLQSDGTRSFTAYDTDMDGKYGEGSEDQLLDAEGVPLTDAEGNPVIEPVKILQDVASADPAQFVLAVNLGLFPATIIANGTDTTSLVVEIEAKEEGVPFGAVISLVTEDGVFLSSGSNQVVRTVDLNRSGSEFTADGDILLTESIRAPQSDEAQEVEITVIVPGTEIEETITLTLKPDTSPRIEQVQTVTGEYSAPVGSRVRLVGRNFGATDKDSLVTFGGAAAVIKEASSTALLVTVPREGVSGSLSVTVKGQTADVGQTFEVLPGVVPGGVSPSGSEAASVNTAISVNFTDELWDIDTTNFLVKDSAGVEVLGMVDIADDGKSASFTPLSELEALTSYTVSLPEQDFTSTFTTGEAPDLTEPTLLSVTPAHEATGVDPRGAITITFSEAIARYTVGQESFQVTADGLEVEGAFSFAKNDTQVIFTPTQTTVIEEEISVPGLIGGTTYTVTLGEDITDLSGNPLTTTTPSTFATQTAIGEFSARAATGGATIKVFGGVFSTTASDNTVTFVTQELMAAGISGSTAALQGAWSVQQVRGDSVDSTFTFEVVRTRLLNFVEPNLDDYEPVSQSIRSWDATTGKIVWEQIYQVEDVGVVTEVYTGSVSGEAVTGTWSDGLNQGAFTATIAPAADLSVFESRTATVTPSGATAHVLTLTVPEDLTTEDNPVVLTEVTVTSQGVASNPRTFTVTSRNAPMFTQTAVGLTPAQIAVNPAGTRLLVSAQDAGVIVEMDTETGAKTGREVRTGSVPTDIVFHPTSDLAFAPLFGSEEEASTDVAVINTKAGAVVTTIDAGKRPTRAALNPDGTLLFVSNYADNTVTAQDLSTLSDTGVGTAAIVGTIPTGNGPNGIAIAPDGKKGYVANFFDGTVTVFDAEKFTTITTLEVGAGPARVAISPTGEYVVVTNHRGGSLSLIDGQGDALIETTALLVTAPGDAPNAAGMRLATPFAGPLGVQFSANGARIYVNNQASDTVAVLAVLSIDRSVSSSEDGRQTVTLNGLRLGGWSAGAGVEGLEPSVASFLKKAPTRTLAVVSDETGIATGRGPAGAVVSSDGTKLFVVNQVEASVQTIFLQNPLPQITALSRTSGDIGGSVTIAGVNFSATIANNRVFFGPVEATINDTTSSETELEVVVPDITSATAHPDFVSRGDRLPFPLPIFVQVTEGDEARVSTPRFFLVTPKIPVVIGSTPVTGVRTALPDSVITLHFSEPMNPDTLATVDEDEESALFGETVNHATNFIIRRVITAAQAATESTATVAEETEDVEGTVAFIHGGKTVVFTPAERLPAEAVIRYSISNGVMDLDGNAVTRSSDADPNTTGFQVYAATFKVSNVSYVGPRIKFLTPRYGPPEGGTTVVVTGWNFIDNTRVYFGPPTEAFLAKDIVVNSSTSISCVTPPNPLGGPVTVRLLSTISQTTTTTVEGQTSVSTATTDLFGELDQGFVYDLGTTVVGRVVDRNGTPLPGATVRLLGVETSSGEGGVFSLANVPAAQGDLVLTASLGELFGYSKPFFPLGGATTDVGDVKVTPDLTGDTVFNTPPVIDVFGEDGASPPPAVLFADRDGSKTVSAGDTLAIRFDQAIRLQNFDANALFAMPVAGDRLGEGATVKLMPPMLSGEDVEYWVQVTVGKNPFFKPGGSFSFRTRAAGSPSGIDVRSDIPRNALESSRTGLDAQDLPAPDLDDNGADIVPAQAPRISSVSYSDLNDNGQVDAGDVLLVKFNQAVIVAGGEPREVFQLLIAGDNFGEGARLSPVNAIPGVLYPGARITLGSGAKIAAAGSYEVGRHYTGAPSGLDMLATAPAGRIVSATTGLSARPLEFRQSATPRLVKAVRASNTLSLYFSEPVTLDLDVSNALSVSELVSLPVVGDDLGASAAISGLDSASQSVTSSVITVLLGGDAQITASGVFAPGSVNSGSASGINIAAGLPYGTFVAKATGANLDPLPAPIDIEATDAQSEVFTKSEVSNRRDVQAGSAPTLISCDYIDEDGNSAVNAGDRLVLSFSRAVRVNTFDPSGTFSLPVSGDALGTNAKIRGLNGDSLETFTGDVEIVLGTGAVLTPEGFYDASATEAGAPSGLAIASTMRRGAIVDLISGQDVSRGDVCDVTLVTGPTLSQAFLRDVNEDGQAGEGDVLILRFSGSPGEDVIKVNGSPSAADALHLPVAGDSLGAGAVVTPIPGHPLAIAVTLGAGAHLTLGGVYSSSTVDADSPSGIDVSATLPANVIEDLYTRADVEDLGTINDNEDLEGVDIQFFPGPRLMLATYQDRNSNRTVDAGDALRLIFTEEIRLAAGATPEAVFALMVTGDSFGTGATLALDESHSAFGDALLLTLGQGAVLTPQSGELWADDFNALVSSNKVNSEAGQPSALDVREDLALNTLEAMYSGVDAQGLEYEGILMDLLIGTEERPRIADPTAWGQYPVLRDVDGSGGASVGDQLFIPFDTMLKVTPSALSDVNGDGSPDAGDLFVLPVEGDRLGTGATVALALAPGQTQSRTVLVTLGAAPVLTVNGSYDEAFTLAGAPSGIELRANAAPNVIEDFFTGADASDGGEPGVDDSAYDIKGPPRPRIDTNSRQIFEDRDENGLPSLGDRIIVTFDQPVLVRNNNAAAVFALPVEGDSFGLGAACYSASTISGQPSFRVVIELGTSPILTLVGDFDVLRRKPGNPSGLDVRASMPRDAIESFDANNPLKSGIDAVDLGAPGQDDAGVDVFYIPGAFILYAEFLDKDGSESSSAGDQITVGFGVTDPISKMTRYQPIEVNNPDANAIFSLPVQGDTLGVGAVVKKSAFEDHEVVITLGTAPKLTPGDFHFTQRKAGDGSGLDIKAPMPANAIQAPNGVDVRDLPRVGVNDTGVPITLIERAEIESVLYRDANTNRTIDAGDLLLVYFSGHVRVNRLDAAGVFHLFVPGDSLGASPTMTLQSPGVVAVKLGSGVKLTPAGDFDPTPAGLLAGRSSSMDVSATMPVGAITDDQGIPVADQGLPRVNDRGQDLEYETGFAPTVQWVGFDDRDGNGSASVGDLLVVEFSQPIRINGTPTPESVFVLPVQGDGFGAGATISGPFAAASSSVDAAHESSLVIITLGASPSITPGSGMPFDRTQIVAGSPSGLDLRADLAPDLVEDKQSGLDAEDLVPSSLDLAQGESAGANLSLKSVNVNDSGVAITDPGAGLAATISTAQYYDADNSRTVTQGDLVQIQFSNRVYRAPSATPSDLFALPVAGDSLGTGAVFANSSEGVNFSTNRLTIQLGAGAALTAAGPFSNAAIGVPGSPSGIDVKAARAPFTLSDEYFLQVADLGARGVDDDGVDIVPQEGPRISGTPQLRDMDGSNSATEGDVLRLSFTSSVRLGVGVTDPAQVFALPVAGDAFGLGAAIRLLNNATSSSTVEVVLGSNSTLTPAGAFDPNALTAGAASGISVRHDMPAGALRAAFSSSVAGQTFFLDAVDEAPVGDPVGAADLVLQAVTAPRPSGVQALDADASGTLTPGDVLRVTFSTSVHIDAVAVSGDLSALFALPVSGDSLGSGLALNNNDSSVIAFRLGSGASLTIPGTFSATNTSAGAPSGLNLAPNLPRTVVTAFGGASAGRSAEPAFTALDVALGTLPFQTVNTAIFIDRDGDGAPGAGDAVQVRFGNSGFASFDGSLMQDLNGNGQVEADDLFALPVPGDTFGAGSTIIEDASGYVTIVLGSTPVLTVGGVYVDGATSGPSGLDLRADAVSLGVLRDTTNNLPIVDRAPGGDGQGADIVDGTPNAAPKLSQALYSDINGDGIVNAGDRVTLTFSQGVRLNTTSADGSVFFFWPGGNGFGIGATMGQSFAGSSQVIVTLGADPVLNPLGQADQNVIDATGPSGIDILASGWQTDAIESAGTGVDAEDGGIINDNSDFIVDITMPIGPVISSSLFLDGDGNGPDEGDLILVNMNTAVTLGGAVTGPEQVFVLLNTADTLGTGATIAAIPSGSPLLSVPGGSSMDLVITLGAGAALQMGGQSRLDVLVGLITELRGTNGSPAEDFGRNGVNDTAPAIQEPQPVVLQSARFLDQNQTGAVDQGDIIQVTFTQPVRVNVLDPNQVFVLPVPGDGFGTGATIVLPTNTTTGTTGGTTTTTTTQTHQTIAVLLGTDPVLSVFGTFLPESAFVEGDPSGIDIAASLPADGVETIYGLDATDLLTPDLDEGTGIDIEFSGGATPPQIASIHYQDSDFSNTVNGGDALAVFFDHPVLLSPALTDPSAVFELLVSGDNFGVGAQVASFPGENPALVAVLLGDNPVLNPGGVFDPADLSAGAPSGLNVTATLGANLLEDPGTGVDARPNLADTRNDIGFASFSAEIPEIVSVVWCDSDEDGAASEGDQLIVLMSTKVRLATTDANLLFRTPVTGDSLGAGATVAAAPYDPMFRRFGTLRPWSFFNEHETDLQDDEYQLVITLGSAPSLTVGGHFAAGARSAGAPSGLDISFSAPADALEDPETRVDALSNDGADIEPNIIHVARARYSDRNASGAVDAGDFIEVEFDGEIEIPLMTDGFSSGGQQTSFVIQTGTQMLDEPLDLLPYFTLPVAGDGFGTGAATLPLAGEFGVAGVIIELGQNPVLTLAGRFDRAQRVAGSPSGLDFRAKPVPTPDEIFGKPYEGEIRKRAVRALPLRNADDNGVDIFPEDTDPPTVAVTSPQNGASITGTNVVVTGTAADPSGIRQVLVAGAPAVPTTTDFATWQAVIPVNAGAGTILISVEAVDGSGNSAFTDVTVSVAGSSGSTGALGANPPSVVPSVIGAPVAGAANPGTLSGYAAIYDPIGDRTVIFGGITQLPAQYSNKVWEFRQGGAQGEYTWTDITPGAAGPGARAFMRGVYLPVTVEMLFFGGQSALGLNNDTWTLDLSVNPPVWNLRAQSSPGAPTGRARYGLVHDSGNDRVVLFGGLDANGPLSDVWEYKPGAQTWAPLTISGPSPRPRLGFAHGYDATKGRMVVFGGSSGVPDTTGVTVFDDTWILNLTAGAETWIEHRNPQSDYPGPRTLPAWGVDDLRGILYFAGGFEFSGTSALPDSQERGIWAFDFASDVWSEKGFLVVTHGGIPMTFDPDDSHFLLHGGLMSPPSGGATSVGNYTQFMFVGDTEPLGATQAPTVDGRSRFWMVGSAGTVISSDGQTFSDRSVQTSSTIAGVWWEENPVVPDAKVSVVDGSTNLYVYDQETANPPSAIAGLPGPITDVAVGPGLLGAPRKHYMTVGISVVSYDGANSTTESSSDATLHAIVSNEDWVVAVGDSGTVHYLPPGASGFSVANVGAAIGLFGIAVEPAATSTGVRMIAVGEGGRIFLSQNASTWTESSRSATLTTETLNDVWIAETGKAYIVGAGGSILVLEPWDFGVVVHNAPAGVALNGVFGFGTLDVWAVGTQSTVLHFDGQSWNSVTTGVTGVDFQAIHGGDLEYEPPEGMEMGVSFAHDTGNDRFVLFGGLSTSDFTTPLNGVWFYELATNTWVRANPLIQVQGGITDIPALANAAMTYDSINERLLIVGGWDGSQTTSATYELLLPTTAGAPSVFQPVSTQGAMLSPRKKAMFAFDAARRQAVLYGGDTGTGSLINDTLLFDTTSNTWTDVTATAGTTAPAVEHPAFVVDAANNRVIRFAGNETYAGGQDRNDVWALPLAPLGAWTQVTVAADPVAGTPSGRHAFEGSAYSADDGALIVVGGYSASLGDMGDSWVLKLDAGQEHWRQITPHVPGQTAQVWGAAYLPLPRGQMFLWMDTQAQFARVRVITGGGGTGGSFDTTAPTFGGLEGVLNSPAGPGSARLSWQPASDDQTPPENLVYEIFASTSSPVNLTGVPTVITAPGAGVWTVTGLTAGQRYFFVVRAVDEAGNSDANTIEKVGFP